VAQKRGRLLRCDRQTLLDCLRTFLTPAVLRSMHSEVPHWDENAKSWELTALVWTGLFMSILDGREKFGKRFDEAREVVAHSRPKRKAPGRSVNGYLMALRRLPYRALVALRTAVRRQIRKELGHWEEIAGWIAFAVDGSRLQLPRSEINERTWGCNREAEAPNLWVTAILTLATGVTYDWCFGPGKSSERAHLLRMLSALPLGCLIVGDIGFCGYDQITAIIGQGRHVLIRCCSTTQLLTEGELTPSCNGWKVWLWPNNKRQQQPLELRAIKIKEPGHKEPIWLLTDIMDARQLSKAAARELYKARWNIEIDVFRALKQTLGKAKLMGKTPAIVLREAELALLGLMLCQAMGAKAICGREDKDKGRFSMSKIKDLVVVYAAKIRRGIILK